PQRAVRGGHRLRPLAAARWAARDRRRLCQRAGRGVDDAAGAVVAAGRGPARPGPPRPGQSAQLPSAARAPRPRAEAGEPVGSQGARKGVHMSAPSDVFLTREELAALFRVDRQTISNWLRQNKLPQPLRLGRQLLWRRETLDRFLSQFEEP